MDNFERLNSRYEFEISVIVRRQNIHMADVLNWCGIDSFPDNFTNCANYLSESFARQPYDMARAQNFPLYAFALYQQEKTPEGYLKFQSNLDEFFKEMNDHEGDTNQFEFLSSRDTLTACESNLKRVRDLLPQEKRPDMEDRIKKIQYLQTRCKP